MRIYEFWSSKNRFICSGRLMLGPSKDFPVYLTPYILILLLLLFFFIIIFPSLFGQYNIILIGFLISVGINIFLIFKTIFMNPGIIPKRPFLEYIENKIQDNFIKESERLKGNKLNYQQLLCQSLAYQQIQYLLYISSDVSQVFCSTCQIYRPDRASHCGNCGNCILRFDHHCPFLNSCIAQNNYKYFVSLLTSLALTFIMFGLSILAYLSSKFQQNDNSNIDTITIIAITIIGLVGLLLISFLIFHLFIWCRGKTTRQLIKQRRAKKLTNTNQKNIQNNLNDQLLTSNDLLFPSNDIKMEQKQQIHQVESWDRITLSNQEKTEYKKQQIVILPNSSCDKQYFKTSPKSNLTLSKFIQKEFPNPQDQTQYYKQLFLPENIEANGLLFNLFRNQLTSKQQQIIRKGIQILSVAHQKWHKTGTRYIQHYHKMN